jgi:ribosomal protein L19
MNEIIKNYEQSQIQQILKSSKVSDFAPGDTVKVNVKIKEGKQRKSSGIPRRMYRSKK